MESIIRQIVDRCYCCGRYHPTDTHHVFGGSNRKASDQYGLTIRICRECHRAIHEPRNEDERRMGVNLKRCIQTMAMRHYGWSKEDWLKHFTKSYTED